MAIRMGGKHIGTLSDFVRHRFDIERTCACGHRNVLSSHAVRQIFRKKAVPSPWNAPQTAFGVRAL